MGQIQSASSERNPQQRPRLRERLMQASLASFLFQHGSTDRAVSRHYLDGLFRREGCQQEASATDAIRNPLPTTA